jgi:TRAP-type C4-dicarboxylate transport system substrate-binding protein
LLRLATIAALGLCIAHPALAEPVQLRLAGIAPDGASWTRELKAWARDVELRTEGRVRVKWYWGGIAGDELTVLDRIRRGQLDGQAGAQFCDHVAPSLRVLRVLGLFQNREENSFGLRKLSGTLEREFRESGFFGFAAGLGSDIVFTREPLRSLADLRRLRIWVWDLDETLIVQLRKLGVHVVPLPIDAAGRAYDDGKVDGFVSIPTAALAFQWSAKTRWFTDLHLAFLPGCLAIANRAVDALSLADKASIREAIAKLRVRFEDLGRSQDEALLGGLFAKQGTHPVPLSETARAELFDAARDARASIPASQVPETLLTQVQSWLADFRSEQSNRKPR